MALFNSPAVLALLNEDAAGELVEQGSLFGLDVDVELRPAFSFALLEVVGVELGFGLRRGLR